MSRSSLGVKICISQLIEGLNDDDCLDVIMLIQHELGHRSVRKIVTRIIMQCIKNLKHQSFIKIQQKIRQKYHATSSTNNNSIAGDHVLFPLHLLPHDLVWTTSLFLNETDILKFEQCCRFFYTMINNTSYLRQCNNFKQFTITKKRLNQMRQKKYSFFKYSTTNQLSSMFKLMHYHKPRNSYSEEKLLAAVLHDFETTMNQIQKMRSYDNWCTNLFKSISILNIDMVGVLLAVMPIDILFNPDPNISHLETVELSYLDSHSFQAAWNNTWNIFETKYLQYKKELEKQGLKIKSLKCIKHWQLSRERRDICMIGPRYIHSKHVWINGVRVDLTDDKFLTKECNPGMKILTIERWIDFVTINDHNSIYKSINIIKNLDRGLEIETMRLISYWNHENPYFFNNKMVIDSLNLQNSLENLTMELVMQPIYVHQVEALENVMLKRYYYNLENVNIMIEIDDNTSMVWFFELLQKNQQILKHQFKQLNIAIVKNIIFQQKVYFVFEWNTNMNEERLNQLNEQFQEMKWYDQRQMQFKEKYSLMKAQWLN